MDERGTRTKADICSHDSDYSFRITSFYHIKVDSVELEVDAWVGLRVVQLTSARLPRRLLVLDMTSLRLFRIQA